jgi:hypothetical protein
MLRLALGLFLGAAIIENRKIANPYAKMTVKWPAREWSRGDASNIDR